MSADPLLSLAEGTVLALLARQPAHGYAIAQLTSRGGELGRAWQMYRSEVYRALRRLADARLIISVGAEAGRGPERTVYAVTRRGRAAAARWLDTPVEHVRDMDPLLLLKLALLNRAGRDPADLLRRQRAVLEPIAQGTEASYAICMEIAPGEFEATLLAWRRAGAEAALEFLDTITS